MRGQSRPRWLRLAAHVARERIALAGLALAFSLGILANAAIHAGNYGLVVAGSTSVTTGFATAMQAVGIVFAAPLLAVLTSPGQRLNVAIASAALTSIGFLALLTHSHAAPMYAGRFLLGCGVGLGMALAEYLAVGQVRNSLRVVFAPLFGLTLAAGHAFGALFTTLLQNVALAALIAGVFIILVYRVSRLGTVPAVQATRPRDFVAAIAYSPLIYASAALYGFLDNGLLSLLPDFLATASLSRQELVLTSFVAFAGICAFQIPSSILATRYLSQAVLRIGVLLLMSAVLLLSLNSGSVWIRNSTVFAIGGLVDVIYTVGLIGLSVTIPRHMLMAANACFVSSCGLGEVAGPMVTGPAISYGGFAGGAAAILAVLAAYWAISAWPRRAAVIPAPHVAPQLGVQSA